jgi:S-adenosylmethionine decarboxylase
MNTSTWGYHLLVDAVSGDTNKIKDHENIKKFIEELVAKIDMKAFGEPKIAHFATHDPEKAGYSFCQMIETSHIAGHFVDKNGNFYIDIFSCKPFKVSTSLSIIKQYFNPWKLKYNFISRDA